MSACSHGATRALVGLCAASAFVAVPSYAQDRDDHAAVSEAMTGFVTALNALDLVAMAGYFADDITAFVPSAQPDRANGKAAVTGIFRTFVAPTAQTPSRLQPEPEDLTVEVSLGLAVATFQIRDHATGMIRRRTFVFRRTAGPWLISHFHASDVAAAPQAVTSDSAFAELQERGAHAMGVDQYTSTHVFESLPDGGRIVLQRDSTDAQGTATIRAHMQDIAERFAAGDFSIPSFVHAQVVPGTDVMVTRRALIRYVVENLPRGAQLRIMTGDSAAIAAIHEFLAFQRMDHRAGGHTHDPAHKHD